jgi:hypothetical protein
VAANFMANTKMRGALAAGLITVGMLGACGTIYLPGSNHRSTVLSSMRDAAVPRKPVTLRGSSIATREEKLQAAAFAFLRGRTGAEAVALLRADGWDCAERTCATGTTRQEVGFLVGTREPGPARRFVEWYRLTMPQGVIVAPADIEAATVHRTEDV